MGDLQPGCGGHIRLGGGHRGPEGCGVGFDGVLRPFPLRWSLLRTLLLLWLARGWVLKAGRLGGGWGAPGGIIEGPGLEVGKRYGAIPSAPGITVTVGDGVESVVSDTIAVLEGRDVLWASVMFPAAEIRALEDPQLCGVSGRIPDSTPQRARHSPASLQPLVSYAAGCSSVSFCLLFPDPCCSLLPSPCWTLFSPSAGSPLTLKCGQGSLQLRSRGVDEGAPGDLTSTESTKGCSELWLVLLATRLQPPVLIPVGVDQGQSLGILAQKAQGPQGAAGDGPGQVAGGAVPEEGRGAPHSHSQKAQHP